MASVGGRAPSFALHDLAGTLVTLDELRALGKSVLLIFSAPACGPCKALMPQLARWEQEYGDALTITVVSRGASGANRTKMDPYGLSHVLVQNDREVETVYGVLGTPSGVLIRPDGTIGSPLAQGEAEITRLVSDTVRPEGSDSVARVPAPDFSLGDLDDATVTLGQFRGKTSVVLFWNPGCGYCQQMLDDLKAWESRAPIGRPQLIIVSTGSAADNRALGLRSTVVLDAEFAVATKFGATGTPSAVRVDAEGFVSSQVAVGAGAVFALLGPAEFSSAAPNDVVGSRSDGQCRSAGLTAFPLGTKPLKRDCVEDELLSDSSIVLYNGCQHQVLTLNPTGAFVWESCDGEHDVDDIVAELRELFPASTNIEGDVRQLLDKLAQTDMIQPAPEGVDSRETLSHARA